MTKRKVVVTDGDGNPMMRVTLTDEQMRLMGVLYRALGVNIRFYAADDNTRIHPPKGETP